MSDEFEPASFRDRNSRVFQRDFRVFRALTTHGLRDWESLASTRFFRAFSDRGALVPTHLIEDTGSLVRDLGSGWIAALEHERLPFISYPYEWAFGMLKDAALLQLDLLFAALEEGMILKDASAYNLQFRGASPVFIDVGSFSSLKPGQPWVGYRQFCQLFLYPLMLQAYKDVSFQPWLRGSLEGIEPRDANAMMGARDVFRRGVLTHVKLQAAAQARFGTTTRDVRADLRNAGFDVRVIKANVSGLRHLVSRLRWKEPVSAWVNYSDDNSYAAADADRKAAFVRAACSERRRPLVWDLGANTGTYSRIAAEHAGFVVALDADAGTIERHYQLLKRNGSRTILPLVGNLADPAPGLGWRGLERLPLERRGRPDLILCLALIHHVVIGANVPLDEFVDWLADLQAELVIEFITKEDAMVQLLLRGKEDQYAEYNPRNFETLLLARFDVIRTETLKSGTRTLFYARPRASHHD